MTKAPINDLAQLTRYIEARFHARHREQLPELVKLAEKVETKHPGDITVPLGLASLLGRIFGNMEDHMRKEEMILFPMIREGGVPGIQGPITVMRADHNAHANELNSIRELTDGLSLPQGACRTWTALYKGLSEFITDLEEHIRIENDVLFPVFETQH